MIKVKQWITVTQADGQNKRVKETAYINPSKIICIFVFDDTYRIVLTDDVTVECDEESGKKFL